MHPIAIALAAATATITVLTTSHTGEASPRLTMVDSPRAEADNGPAIGLRMPANLALRTGNGDPVSLSDITGERGVVILFTRSADWCPRCRSDLDSIGAIENEIAARGYRLAAATIDAPGALAVFAERDGIGYPLLSDEDSTLIDALSLRDPMFGRSSFVSSAPRVSAIVIGRDGRVRAAVMGPGHGERPSDYRILAALDSLSAS